MPDQAPFLRPADRPDPILANAPHRIGTVALVVNDLDRVSGFYQEVIGLRVLGEGEATVTLGVPGAALLELRHDPAARRWTAREAGLFHTAFLLQSRADLGAWLRHMAEGRHPIAGASDHIVSEAVYLADPEGNGIEVYADRPSAGWPWAHGAVAMSTEALDAQDVMGAARAPWSGAPAGSSVGHVHLQAGDLSRAGAFYAGLLGFDITARYPGALFFGSGGYHHQLAGNIWNSRGAPVRSGPTTGLAEVELVVTNAELLAMTHARLTEAATPVTEVATGLVVRDPWGTALRLVAPRSSPTATRRAGV